MTKHKTEDVSPDVVVSEKKIKTDAVDPKVGVDISSSSWNLFRLQIVDVLNDISLSTDERLDLETYIKQIEKYIFSIPTGEEYDLNNIDWLSNSGIQYPLDHGSRVFKGSFRFYSPSKIDVVGSYSFGAVKKPMVTVDLAVQMPAECFGKRDYLNEIYHRKRCLFLCWIAKSLKSNVNVSDHISFILNSDDTRKPFIQFSPTGSLGSICRIRLLPYPAEAVFSLKRFSVTNGNVRPSWYFSSKVASTNTVSEESIVPTPSYNQSMIRDIVMVTVNAQLVEKLGDIKNAQQSLQLLHLFLENRPILMAQFCISGFHLNLVVLHFVLLGKIKPQTSHYQILRLVFLFFAEEKWIVEGTTLGLVSFVETDNSIQLKQHFDMIFTDANGNVNFFADLSINFAKQLQSEAKRALSILNYDEERAFDILFMRTNIDLAEYFDHIFEFSLAPKQIRRLIKTKNEDYKIMDLCDELTSLGGQMVTDVLLKGLGPRIDLMQCYNRRQSEWSVESRPYQAGHDLKLTFGLLINPEFSAGLVDIGPTANSDEAAAFRQFWGDRAELRKFADGTISEAVVWNPTVPEDPSSVMEDIVTYLLKKYFEVSTSSVHYIVYPFSHLLQSKSICKVCQKKSTHRSVDLFMNIQRTFDYLSKSLRSLKDLQLTVTHVQPCSSILSSTSVFVPPNQDGCVPKGSVYDRHDQIVPRPGGFLSPFWIPSMEVIIGLEGSGKWPDDLEALGRLKGAFYIKIGAFLKERGFIVQPSLEELLTQKNGHVFRLVIGLNREIGLLKRVVMDSGLVKEVDNLVAQQLAKRIIYRPSLQIFIKGLVPIHPNFTHVCRLAKRWLAMHMLGNHVSEEAVDLIVASLYVTPEGLETPKSIFCGFVRFLKLLANFDWLLNCLIVNFNGELKKEEIAEVRSAFHEMRPTLPVVCICTPTDRKGNMWTTPSPSPEIVDQMARLAQSSLKLLNKSRDVGLSSIDQWIRAAFRPVLTVFDVLIHLNVRQVARRYQRMEVTPQEMPQLEHHSGLLPVVDYAPEDLYLTELKKHYGDVALFCYDVCGGDVIGVVWKPSARNELDFKVSQINGRKLAKNDSNRIRLNYEAVADHFSIIGKGLVRKVDVKTEPA